jgi:flavorubredoxin
MKAQLIKNNVYKIGAVDWDRRLFDALIPLPDGTSYNSYLIKASEKTVLAETVDPAMTAVLLEQLKDVPVVDYVIMHHVEQDHSGSLPVILAKYPQAKVLCTARAKGFAMEHLLIAEDRFQVVNDGATLSLGDKTLEFIHTPWVHWPETMVTYLREDQILLSCDFFGSHIATTDLYVTDECRIYEAAKRYFAEIMLPFRKVIQGNMEKLKGREISVIAPSHGPLYDRPAFIMDAYREWTAEMPKNVVVIPYISMHGSTQKMVEYLVSALAARGVTAYQFNMADTDIGKVAITLVDAATIVVGTPTVHLGAHPNVICATFLANALRPKVKFASVIGSHGWSTKAVEQIAGLIPNLQVEIIPPVIAKGYPKEADFQALDKLAETIAEKHKALGLK